MSPPEPPVNNDKFRVDVGKDKDIDKFARVNLPKMSTESLEHDSGDSGKRFVSKHSGQKQNGGELRLTFYAKGDTGKMKEWMQNTLQWKEGTLIKDISVQSELPEGKAHFRWEYRNARINGIEFDSSFSSDGTEILTCTATIHVEEGERKKM